MKNNLYNFLIHDQCGLRFLPDSAGRYLLEKFNLEPYVEKKVGLCLWS